MKTYLAVGFAVLMAFPALAETRVALVIANAAYAKVSPLRTPGNDASLVAASLRKVGFSVTVKKDADRESMTAALKDFARTAEGADVALVYYAGHGVEVRGTNYLVPVDASLAYDRDVEFEAMPLPTVLRALEGAHRLRLVVLDACRNNPFKLAGQDGRRAVTRGLARIEPDGDTLVAYAARDGTTAADGTGNSPFASAFAKELVVPGQEVRLMFGRVRDDVMTATARGQEPYLYGTLGGAAFYFVAPTAVTVVTPPAAAAPGFDARQVEVEFWKSVADSGDVAQLQSYLDQYPNGIYAGVARAKIRKLQVAYAPAPTPVAAPPPATHSPFAPAVQYVVEAARQVEQQARTRADEGRRKAEESRSAQARAKQAAEWAVAAAKAARDKTAGYVIQDGKNDDGKWHYEGAATADGKANGYGVFKGSKGIVYQGEWRDDKENGVGTMTWTNGDRYEGEFQDDKRTGLGVYHWPDGDRYEGDEVEGKSEGKGVYFWANGDRYEGDYRNDKMNGDGVYYGGGTRSYREKVGQFVNDKNKGYAVIYWKDGTSIVEQISDNETNGYAAKLDANGTVIEQGYYEKDKLKTALTP